jgi:hypothetical protein
MVVDVHRPFHAPTLSVKRLCKPIREQSVNLAAEAARRINYDQGPLRVCFVGVSGQGTSPPAPSPGGCIAHEAQRPPNVRRALALRNELSVDYPQDNSDRPLAGIGWMLTGIVVSVNVALGKWLLLISGTTSPLEMSMPNSRNGYQPRHRGLSPMTLATTTPSGSGAAITLRFAVSQPRTESQ